MGLRPRAGWCNAAAAIAVAVAVSVTVAVVAYVAAAAPTARVADGGVDPLAASGQLAAVAAAFAAAPSFPAVRGVLPAVDRPLSADVSVSTDGTYTLLQPADTSRGCPPMVTIAGPLNTANGSFVVEPPRLTVGGVECVGAADDTVLVGLFGATLIDIATRTDLYVAPLLALDPRAAVGVVIEGPLTCGAAAFGQEFWTFFIVAGVPVLELTSADPGRPCTLVDHTTAPATAAAVVPAAVPTGSAASVSGVVRARAGEVAAMTGRVGV